MANKQEIMLDKIHEAVLVECSIQCQKCKKIRSSYNYDDYTFAERTLKEGWTVKRNRVLCYECNVIN